MLSQSAITPVIPVTDLDRARKFYVNTLGLKGEGKVGNTDYMVGVNGSHILLSKRAEPTKNEYTALTFEVGEFENEMKDLKDHGVKFEEYDLPNLHTHNGVFQDETAKCAWFKDPEGNILCIHKYIQK